MSETGKGTQVIDSNGLSLSFRSDGVGEVWEVRSHNLLGVFNWNNMDKVKALGALLDILSPFTTFTKDFDIVRLENKIGHLERELNNLNRRMG